MVSVSSIANKTKAVNGINNQNAINSVLSNCLSEGYISDFQKNFRIGNPEAENEKQFYAPFMIQFPNRNRWVIFATTSMRTDRIKGQQWDAYNLKELDSSITTALIVYPANKVNNRTFKKQDLKYQQKQEISAIDRIFNYDELRLAIQNEFYSQVKEEINIDDKDKNLKDSAQIETFLNNGHIWDRNGKNFEIQIATILSSKDYLSAWDGGNDEKNDKNYLFFCKMMDGFNIQKHTVKSIKATASKEEIGYLPSGGSPKTDVIAKVKFNDKTTKLITISCKRSKADTVSVHQYTADLFADVLDTNNEHLRKLLNSFQFYGNLRDLPNGIAEELEFELKPHIRQLVMWAIGGVGGAGDKDTQWAQYIVSYQTTKDIFNVHSIDEYCDIVCKNTVMLGTPFHWTYASKSKGKNIQLKAPLV